MQTQFRNYSLFNIHQRKRLHYSLKSLRTLHHPRYIINSIKFSTRLKVCENQKNNEMAVPLSSKRGRPSHLFFRFICASMQGSRKQETGSRYKESSSYHFSLRKILNDRMSLLLHRRGKPVVARSIEMYYCYYACIECDMLNTHTAILFKLKFRLRDNFICCTRLIRYYKK